MTNLAPKAPSKVLVIDDEEGFRQLIVRFLSKRGLELAGAPDGKAGVALAAQILPDLVICDLNMPGMDGYEVLATLRRDARLADIPIIFLTGQAAPSQVRHGMNLGADDYLTKPVEFDNLLSAVNVRLARRQAQRQRQEKQIERAMQLFGGIVHDLRDPLFVVLGYTNLLQAGAAADAGPDASKRMLDRMQQAVMRMQEIISETLFLARSRMQRLPFDPGPFDLREFCAQLISDHEQSARLRLRCAPGRFPITADALRLRQALENLLSNALKYSDGPVVFSLAAAGSGYSIEVRDQGIGIPPADAAGIFEPFFRASNTGARPGHGLGLSIVKSCIEQHGGSVRFISDPNCGTTFFLELPKSPASATPAATVGAEAGQPSPAPTRLTTTRATAERPSSAWQALPSTAVAVHKPTAVVIDDDPLVRCLLRDLLENDLVILGEAGTLVQARLLVQQRPVEVVFLDVNLPDGSGFDLLPDLKPAVSVVFVTSAEEYAVHAFDCDAVDYLLKPVSPERLNQALSRVRQRLGAKAVPVPTAASPQSGTFLVKTLTEKRLVKVHDIRRIIAYGEYSWVYWDAGKKGALLRKSLKQWLFELPSTQFIRVHRGAIVNLAYLERIERLSGGQLQVHLRDTAEPIPVSLRLAPVLNRRLKALRG